VSGILQPVYTCNKSTAFPRSTGFILLMRPAVSVIRILNSIQTKLGNNQPIMINCPEL